MSMPRASNRRISQHMVASSQKHTYSQQVANNIFCHCSALFVYMPIFIQPAKPLVWPNLFWHVSFCTHCSYKVATIMQICTSLPLLPELLFCIRQTPQTPNPVFPHPQVMLSGTNGIQKLHSHQLVPGQSYFSHHTLLPLVLMLLPVQSARLPSALPPVLPVSQALHLMGMLPSLLLGLWATHPLKRPLQHTVSLTKHRSAIPPREPTPRWYC